MQNKYSPTFLGAYECPNCGNLSTHHVIPDRESIHILFALTGIPFTHKKRFVVCSVCGFKRKLKGDFKVHYEQALKNHFDNPSVVKQFVNDIEEVCIENETVKDKKVIEQNLEKATDIIFDRYFAEQGYSREYYNLLCLLYALNADYKYTQFNLMFRT